MRVSYPGPYGYGARTLTVISLVNLVSDDFSFVVYTAVEDNY